ncbi:hypothetical protein CH333_09170 [candidate division WOR-3 bacterium JGI_Cruoil_03_44_89]|uniref:Uncharacterized protein n=1 Tax=candidate division WOR-3 bacterium JGI_Cruoil_03_44_89 TaxID=1973748 RepID=A0A235BNZ6_UNCW3|nr:MAG: hypothetical protein CH333_09170 [candidate division WOR-3 bacterium JGI_Cruoil_03_44_89]
MISGILFRDESGKIVGGMSRKKECWTHLPAGRQGLTQITHDFFIIVVARSNVIARDVIARDVIARDVIARRSRSNLRSNPQSNLYLTHT